MLDAAPSYVAHVDGFASAIKIRDSYGIRMQALFVAPQTGSYLFYSKSDDNSKTYLSTDDQESRKREIIRISPYSTYGFFK